MVGYSAAKAAVAAATLEVAAAAATAALAASLPDLRVVAGNLLVIILIHALFLSCLPHRVGYMFLSLILIEIRFIKFNLTFRAYQTKLSPLEGLARPRALPRPPP